MVIYSGRMSGDDLNTFLLNTKTSQSASHDALTALEDKDYWTRRKKGRKRAPPEELERIEDSTVHHRKIPYHSSLTSNTGSHNVGNHETSSPLSRHRNEEDTKKEALEASSMAHFVLEYVLVRELGGRANARKGDEAASIPPPGLVQAERAQLRPIARDGMLYVCRGSATTRSFHFISPTVIYQDLPEDVIRLRQSLAVCDYKRDLVGGVTGPNAPSIREHLLSLIHAGLLGKKWVPQENTVLQNSLVPSGVEIEETRSDILNLFGNSNKCQPSSAAEGDVSKASDECDDDDDDFSLDKYLHGEDTDEEP